MVSWICDFGANPMIIYTSRPKARRARAVWDYATRLKGREPETLHKNPSCWGKFEVVGNAWGWWVAGYGNDWKKAVLIDPAEVA
jgi:hypothetical protein